MQSRQVSSARLNVLGLQETRDWKGWSIAYKDLAVKQWKKNDHTISFQEEQGTSYDNNENRCDLNILFASSGVTSLCVGKKGSRSIYKNNMWLRNPR